MNGARVLVVDDEPQIQRVLRPSLTASGYEVIEATTGRQALAAVSANIPPTSSSSILAFPTWMARKCCESCESLRGRR